jgi:hypothetical protein
VSLKEASAGFAIISLICMIIAANLGDVARTLALGVMFAVGAGVFMLQTHKRGGAA